MRMSYSIEDQLSAEDRCVVSPRFKFLPTRSEQNVMTVSNIQFNEDDECYGSDIFQSYRTYLRTLDDSFMDSYCSSDFVSCNQVYLLWSPMNVIPDISLCLKCKNYLLEVNFYNDWLNTLLQGYQYCYKEPVAYIDLIHNHTLGHIHCDNCGYDTVDTECNIDDDTFDNLLHMKRIGTFVIYK
ncbi:uncharacterized protein LOC111692432 [Anoplophora glabripennis]|uniref:uncharacterized protein LOC111692432 n=1 Tax=Anoplophora glabripennis TaxID=217634 RepID=UPI000C76B406|nr:uncharacterized protein LOC111692432 [Anoplophora glabripennis]